MICSALKMLYRTAHVKNGSNSFEREISTSNSECPGQAKKKKKKKLEQILDENPCQT